MTIATGQNVDPDDFLIAVTAGEDITAGEALYIDPADDEAYLCDADDDDKVGFVGFAENSVSAGATVYIRCWGIKGGFSSLTPTQPVYLSATAGEITQNAPSTAKLVGYAVSATTIRLTDELSVRERIYTSSDTWNNFDALKWIDVELVGAGGGGGGANGGGSSGAGSGAGGGGYSRKRINAADLGSTETVTIGLGGVGTISSETAGGTTSFGAHCQATGGNPGTQDGAGGVGGEGSGGDFNCGGEGGGKASDSSAIPGQGGSSFFGGGARARAGEGTGAAAAAPGAGGGGAVDTGVATNQNGGDGEDGVVIVKEYF